MYYLELLNNELDLLDKLTQEVKEDKFKYMEERYNKLQRIDQVKENILYLKRMINDSQEK